MTRASAHPVPNAVLLPSIILTQHVGDIYRGNLPDACLPSFLHEATHHWCFHSPAMTYASLLYLRARRGVLVALATDVRPDDALDLSLISSGEVATDILEDYVRYRITDVLLRPLHEGMALFSEFDVAPAHRRLHRRRV